MRVCVCLCVYLSSFEQDDEEAILKRALFFKQKKNYLVGKSPVKTLFSDSCFGQNILFFSKFLEIELYV